MTEREERKPHDAFVQYADPVDVLTAPLLINFNYLSDVARLPGRQVSLAWQTALQTWGLRHPDFAPPPYQGSNLDYAEYVQSLDNVKHDRRVAHTAAEMDVMRAKWLRELTAPVLPQRFSNLEFRFPRYYENEILDLACAHDSQVVFLYVPQYDGPEYPPPYDLYASRADLINPWAVLQDYRLWFDKNHLNWDGAKRITDYVADVLASRNDLR